MKHTLFPLIKGLLTDKKWEPLRYLIVGASCSAGHIVLLYFLTDIIGIFYLYSTIISFLFISLLGYFGQKYFTYRNKASNHAKQLSLFFLIIIIGLVMDTGLMIFFVTIISLHYLLASILTRLIIFVINFLWTKHIAFKKIETVL